LGIEGAIRNEVTSNPVSGMNKRRADTWRWSGELAAPGETFLAEKECYEK